MKLHRAFRFGLLAGTALLAGCVTPATVWYGEVASPHGALYPETVYERPAPGGVYGEPTVIYEEPAVIYEEPAVVVRPAPRVIVPAPVYVPPPVYVDPYPWYPGYPYGPGFGGYYRGQRIAPPPRHVRPPRYRPDDRPGWDGGRRPGPGAQPGQPPRAPYGGLRGSNRPPTDPGQRAPSGGYGPRDSGENSGP
jgi:hypothetical protein